MTIFVGRAFSNWPSSSSTGHSAPLPQAKDECYGLCGGSGVSVESLAPLGRGSGVAEGARAADAAF